MTDQTRDFLEALAQVLLRCWLIGFALLFIWFAAIMAMGAPIYRFHGSMFGLSHHELQVIFYCGMGILKLVVFTCFFIPWQAIRMVLRKQDAQNRLAERLTSDR